MEDVPNTTDDLKQRFSELKAQYKGPIELHLASEYMMDEVFEKHLAEKDFLFHREEGSILMETSTWSGPYNFWDMIDRTMRAGYRPVLAHPERYEYMEDKDYSRLHSMGVRLQLNYPSLLGHYGDHVRDKAAKILKNGWYDMAGSDCHRYRSICHLVTDKVLKNDGVKLLRSLLIV
jgi:tyrosine-protein phosphatase YwqE